MTARLRPVDPDERATEPAKPKTVTEAAKKGTARELLVAMRDRIAKAVEDEKTSPRDLAALTRRLSEVVRDIEAIDARVDQEAAGADKDVSDEPFDASAI